MSCLYEWTERIMGARCYLAFRRVICRCCFFFLRKRVTDA